MHDHTDTPGSDEHGDVPAALIDDIAGRLRPVCAHLPPDEFAALVAEIARTKMRFAHRASSLPGLSGVWDPPADDLLGQAGNREHSGPPPESGTT